MGRTLSHEAVSLPSDRRERVLVYGEVLFDRFQDGVRGLGGAPFNVAWHLCGFGFRPLLISAVGADAQGREILDQMEGWGLSVRAVRSDPEHSTGHVDVRDEKGEPSFSIPADQAWDYIPTDHARAHAPSQGTSLIYHGTLAGRSEPSRRALQGLLAEADAPVFVDANLRDPWWTPETVRDALDGARWAQLNLEELWTLTGTSPGDLERAGSVARVLRQRHGLDRLFVTCADQGAFLVNDEDVVVYSAAKTISRVVDTVGAGDGFCAVACIGLLRGWSDEVILRRANDFAGETCRFQGATRTDIAIYDAYLRHWAELPWASVGREGRQGLYVIALSVHGLVRASGIELGRDADTGGQVSYVVDEARALVEHPDVDRVDVITRQIFDPRVGDAYAQPVETITPGARIVRLPFGPRRYLRKESLWPYLDSLLDQATRFVRSQERLPDIIHGHYADAGYVGAHLASLLGVPFVFTGHSLGRVKRERLLADGTSEESIEKRYRIARRIEAEEQALEAADLVITSTRQEVMSQYERYDHYEPKLMRVIPPGVDLTRFSPCPDGWPDPPILAELKRFLEDPSRPMVLAMARADERKNFQGLIEAFANTPVLRDTANLVLVAGTRDDLGETDPATRRVLMSILIQVDRHDLYGIVAYPKHHHPSDVPDLYRLAARSGGVFVNPALTEPFGLTLIEAAACGLPVVATDDGGPRDIIEACQHGILVDVMDTQALGSAIADALSDPVRRTRWAKNAVTRVHGTFSWRTHTRRYLEAISEVLSGALIAGVPGDASSLPRMDRMLFACLDHVLVGDERALATLVAHLREHGDGVGVGITTGRTTKEALRTLETLDFVTPDVLISASGTEIHYGPRLVRDRSWERQIRHRWDPEGVSRALADFPGLRPEQASRTRYRLRYALQDSSLGLPTVRERLRKAGLRATALLNCRHHLDIVPGRASPGMAVRFMSFKWNLPPTRVLVAGDQGSGADLLSGDTLGVVVGCEPGEMEELIDHPRVYFASNNHGWGVLEGVAHYDFFGDIQPHDEELA